MTPDLRLWRCRHCDSTNRLTLGTAPAGLERQVLHVRHERGCPDYVDEDAMAAAEYDVDRLAAEAPG